MKQLLCLLSMALICSLSVPAFSQDTAEERLNILENSLKSQAIIIEEQQRAMGALKDEIEKQRNSGRWTGSCSRRSGHRHARGLALGGGPPATLKYRCARGRGGPRKEARDGRT